MSCKLLLVEDDRLSRRNMALLLERANHQVYQAETGEAALDLLSTTDFQVVVSDLRLPGTTNGLDVLRRQRNKLPGSRLVLLTAFGSDQARSQAESLGALYREKPILLADLLSCVGNQQ
jgi:DNA-binding response OmpR family regulator